MFLCPSCSQPTAGLEGQIIEGEDLDELGDYDDLTELAAAGDLTPGEALLYELVCPCGAETLRVTQGLKLTVI